MTKKLYIFDFDGVIADTGADIAASVQAAQRYFSVPVMGEKEILSHVGYGAIHLMDNTVPANLTSVDRGELLSWYKQYYFEHCVEKTVLYGGVYELLETLTGQGHEVYMFSNKPGPVALKSLELLGVKQFFKDVMCPEFLEHRKPHPEGILKCMELSGITAENTIMIGDSAADIDAARGAGVHSCGVLSGIGDTEKLLAAGPEITVNSMAEALKVTGDFFENT